MHRRALILILFLAAALAPCLAAGSVLAEFRALSAAQAQSPLPDASTAGMVVTAEPRATLAGLAALQAGRQRRRRGRGRPPSPSP